MVDLPERLASHNLAFVEDLYAQFCEDPASVDPDWRSYFAMMEADRPAPVRIGPSFGVRSIFNPSGGDGNGPSPVGRATSASASAAAGGRHLALVDGAELSARVPYLRSLAMFKDLADEEVIAAARISEPVRILDGEVFVREGELGHDLFVITAGQVVIRRAGRVIAELGPGEVVGEMAVLDREPRSADAVAVGQVESLRIRGEELLGLVEQRPAFARAIIRVLTRRLRDTGTRQDRVDQLIRAYRVRGHLLADLDPLGKPSEIYPELNPAYYGFWQGDLDLLFSSTTIPGTSVMALRDIIAHLRKTYCGSIGVQYMHIDDIKLKMWLQDRMESSQNQIKLSREQQVDILTKLTDAEFFEQFIHKKFIGAKRFSLEGAESLIPLLHLAVETAGEHSLDEIVIGMAHRGRLNVLANILGKSPRQIFAEFEDTDPDRMKGRGDVKYHLGYSQDRTTSCGKTVHLSLTFNPSHLEFVSPVVMGRVRAKQERKGDRDGAKVMGIAIHGDAAFAGQGVVQETFNMSGLEGYNTGGTLHIIVNNQIGFTTNPEDGRSTQYATDIAKMLHIPIFHVNGEHPEAVAQAVNLAMEFREAFRKDVVIDMYCYRRYGHNEGDEPAFTQPELYKKIRKRKSVREAYLDNLYKLGELSPEEAERISVARRERLEQELGVARSPDFVFAQASYGEGNWQGFVGGADEAVPEVETAVAKEKLVDLLNQLAEVPDDFTPHPKVKRLFAQRKAMAAEEVPLDWAAGELLAYSTLLSEGRPVRLSGQDARRGTFSHRHAFLTDNETGVAWSPLQRMAEDPRKFQVWNSPLSEIGVLGFEYGYSLDYPEALVMWEAQFGDFANVAQVIIDQFITSGEDKWQRFSGLTLLLPHGFEGQGPEHSSARLERFLMAAADDNIQVVNLTSPAQVFHMLRRQVLRPLRKPMVVMSPKSLLRLPQAVSTLDQLARGHFQHVIADDEQKVDPTKVRKVVLTSGKLYYELRAERDKRGAYDVALVRVEQYYPLAKEALREALADYRDGIPAVWAQEEPENMGAWPFMVLCFRNNLLERFPLDGVYRPRSASPATGSAAAHKKEQALVIEQAFA